MTFSNTHDLEDDLEPRMQRSIERRRQNDNLEPRKTEKCRSLG